MAKGILQYPYSYIALPSVRTGATINPKPDDFDIKHTGEELCYGRRSQHFKRLWWLQKRRFLRTGTKYFSWQWSCWKSKGGRHKVTTRPGKFIFQNSFWIRERNMVVKKILQLFRCEKTRIWATWMKLKVWIQGRLWEIQLQCGCSLCPKCTISAQSLFDVCKFRRTQHLIIN